MSAKRSAIFFIFVFHISLHLCQQVSPSRDRNDPGDLLPNRRGPSNLPFLEGLESPPTYYPCMLSGDSSGYSSWCGDNKDPSQEPDINDPMSFGEGIRNLMAEQAQSIFNPDTFAPNDIANPMEPSVNTLPGNVGAVQGNANSNGGTVGGVLLSPGGSQQPVADLQSPGAPVPVQIPSALTSRLSTNSLNIQPVGVSTGGTRTIGGAPLANAPRASAALDGVTQRTGPLLFGAHTLPRLVPLVPLQPLTVPPAEQHGRYRLAHLRRHLLKA